jgi:hypothetical protein
MTELAHAKSFRDLMVFIKARAVMKKIFELSDVSRKKCIP